MRTTDEGQKKICAILCRTALAWPQTARRIADGVTGLIDDFRIIGFIREIQRYDDDGTPFDPAEMVEAIQGRDLRLWLVDEVLSQPIAPCDEESMTEYVDDCLKCLSTLRDRAKYGPMIEDLSNRARAALDAGNNDEYLNLLAQQQELRRRIKKINY